MLQLTIKLMNMFYYSIATHFIPSNKDYHSCLNPRSVYQTCPKCLRILLPGQLKLEVCIQLTNLMNQPNSIP